jgi:hypothetical protein
MSMESMLSGYDDEYAQATPMGGEPPDGTYDARIEAAAVTTTKNSGKPMLAYQLKIEGGEHDGRLLFNNRVITEKTLGWVKGDLHMLGIELEKFSHLARRAGELVGKRVSVTKSTDGQYSNVRFNGLLGGPVPSDAPF